MTPASMTPRSHCSGNVGLGERLDPSLIRSMTEDWAKRTGGATSAARFHRVRYDVFRCLLPVNVPLAISLNISDGRNGCTHHGTRASRIQASYAGLTSNLQYLSSQNVEFRMIGGELQFIIGRSSRRRFQMFQVASDVFVTRFCRYIASLVFGNELLRPIILGVRHLTRQILRIIRDFSLNFDKHFAIVATDLDVHPWIGPHGPEPLRSHTLWRRRLSVQHPH